MRTVAHVSEVLDSIAPFSGAAEWDPVGLQLGDPNRVVERPAVCHEVNDAVINAAVAAGVDLLVAYHPLLFAATTSLTAGHSPPGRVLRLAEAGIGLLVTHTAFDVAAGGTAEALAASLGLDDLRKIGLPKTEPGTESDTVAIGRLGTRAPIRLGDLASEVAATLHSPAVRTSGDLERMISEVAVVPGSGSDVAATAAVAGAEVLVTGDVSHHRAVAALDLGLAVIDAGHIPTERPGLAALANALSAALGEDVIDLTAVSVDPWS